MREWGPCRGMGYQFINLRVSFGTRGVTVRVLAPYTAVLQELFHPRVAPYTMYSLEKVILIFF